jgi:osmotically-inducible protein OsmY
MLRTICRTILAVSLVCGFGFLHAQTADQQSNNPSDLQITRQIRKALVNDKSLSTYGHNVKIITQQGVVTLKGSVKSDAEKQEIESKATEVAGSGDKVHSELQVAGSTKEKPSANPDNQ